MSDRKLGFRFWNKIKKAGPDECWEWQRGKEKNGYGHTWFHKRQMRAHRVAFELAYGDIPEGMLVCHSCDNPPCCNPRHLFLGTNRDNHADCVKKGRSRRGSKSNKAKLTESQVLEIRNAYTGKWGHQTELSKLYGVSTWVISSIVRGESWKHVLPDSADDQSPFDPGCADQSQSVG